MGNEESQEVVKMVMLRWRHKASKNKDRRRVLGSTKLGELL